MNIFKLYREAHKEVTVASSFPQEVEPPERPHSSAAGRSISLSWVKMAESGKRLICGHHHHLLASGYSAGTFMYLTDSFVENHRCGKVPTRRGLRTEHFVPCAGSQFCNLEQFA